MHIDNTNVNVSVHRNMNLKGKSWKYATAQGCVSMTHSVTVRGGETGVDGHC